MRLVIADTGPINYLIQIGHIELLPRLFAVQIDSPTPSRPHRFSARSPILPFGLRSSKRKTLIPLPDSTRVKPPQLSRRLPSTPICCSWTTAKALEQRNNGAFA